MQTQPLRLKNKMPRITKLEEKKAASSTTLPPSSYSLQPPEKMKMQTEPGSPQKSPVDPDHGWGFFARLSPNAGSIFEPSHEIYTITEENGSETGSSEDIDRAETPTLFNPKEPLTPVFTPRSPLPATPPQKTPTAKTLGANKDPANVNHTNNPPAAKAKPSATQRKAKEKSTAISNAWFIALMCSPEIVAAGAFFCCAGLVALSISTFGIGSVGALAANGLWISGWASTSLGFTLLATHAGCHFFKSNEKHPDLKSFPDKTQQASMSV